MSELRDGHVVRLIGFVGKDAEMRYTPAGKAVTSFTLATSKKWTGADGQKRDQTVWWKVTAWERAAEIANQYFKKGLQLAIEGTMVVDEATGGPRVWTTQEGLPRASFEITMSEFRFLDRRGNNDSGAEGQPIQAEVGGTQASQSEGAFAPAADDDIPF